MKIRDDIHTVRSELDAAMGPKEPEKQSRARRVATRIFFLVGVAGVAVMVWRLDISKVDWPNLVRHMPYWIPALMLLWAGIYAVHSLSYRLILGEDAGRVPFLRLYQITVSCFAINNVTPIGFMGGEPYRIMEMTPYVGAAKAAASTVTYTVLFGISHVLYWITGCAVYFLLLDAVQSVFRSVVFGLVGAAFAALAAVVLLSRREKPAQRAVNLAAKLPWLGKRVAKLRDKHLQSLESIDREIAFFHHHRPVFFLTAGLEYAARLLEAVEFYMIFRFLGEPMPYSHALFALSTASLVGNALFIIPMQLGSREGGAVMSLEWLGHTASLGVSTSLLCRIREIVFTAIGIGALLIRKKEK